MRMRFLPTEGNSGKSACSKDVPGVYISLENPDGHVRREGESLEEEVESRKST